MVFSSIVLKALLPLHIGCDVPVKRKRLERNVQINIDIWHMINNWKWCNTEIKVTLYMRIYNYIWEGLVRQNVWRVKNWFFCTYLPRDGDGCSQDPDSFFPHLEQTSKDYLFTNLYNPHHQSLNGNRITDKKEVRWRGTTRDNLHRFRAQNNKRWNVWMLKTYLHPQTTSYYCLLDSYFFF